MSLERRLSDTRLKKPAVEPQNVGWGEMPMQVGAGITGLQQIVGNRAVQGLIDERQGSFLHQPGILHSSPLRLAVQLQAGAKKKPANPGGKGPGRMQHAKENYYTVSGSTLDSITSQLNQAGGWGAETQTDLGMVGKVTPKRLSDGTYQVTVKWTIAKAKTLLPQWTDYDKACPAAQTEWDRFMRQTRLHEQTAHVDMARDFVKDLGPDDTVITGASREELIENLVAKQQELADRLQAKHDDCGHGADVDAILHPEKGVCEQESEAETAP